MNTLYLHIGTHKTATTTIQRFCADNRKVFESKGMVYPDFPFRFPFKGPNRNGLFLGMVYRGSDGVRRKDLEKEYYHQALDIIHGLFEKYPSVLLSNERLWMDLYLKDAKLVRKLVKDSQKHGYQIKMIVYLRRQDSFIESFWSETVKELPDRTDTLQEYISEFEFLDYNAILSKYAELIGEENVIVRRFSDAVKVEGGILVDFMRQLGMELTDDFEINDPALNPGIYANVTEIKRIINSTSGLRRDDMRVFINALPMAAATSKKVHPCGELSEEERTDLMQPLEAGNAELAQRFIGDGRPLFSTDYSGLPKREDGNEEFINDIIRSSASVDAVLFRRHKENKLRIHQLEKENRKLKKQLEKQKTEIAEINRKLYYLRHPLKYLLRKLGFKVKK